MIQHTFGLLTRPSAAWRNIAELPQSTLNTLVLYPAILAILPAVAWYYGTTQIGWTIGEHGEPIKLTTESARQICILFYFTMIACVSIIGYFIHWMSETYGAQSSITKGIVTAGLTATPLFLAGLVGFLSAALARHVGRGSRGVPGPSTSCIWGYPSSWPYPPSAASCSQAPSWP